MDAIEEFEAEVSALFGNPSEASSDFIKESREDLSGIACSISGLEFLIGSYNQFINQETRNFAFKAIGYWCAQRWAEISGDVRDQIRSLLFNEAANSDPQLISSQSLFILRIWPDIMSFLAAIRAQPKLLLSICNEISKEPFSSIIMPKLQSEDSMLQVLSDEFSKGVEDAEALPDLSAFLPPSIICSSEFLSNFSPFRPVPSVIAAISAIIERKSCASVHQELSSLVLNAPQVFSSTDEQTLVSAAHFLFSLSVFSSVEDQCFPSQFWLPLLSNSQTVALSALPLLYSTLHQNSSRATQIAQAVVNRLCQFFSENQFVWNPSRFDSFVDSLAILFTACQSCDPEGVGSLVVENLSGFSVANNPNLSSSLLVCLLYMKVWQDFGITLSSLSSEVLNSDFSSMDQINLFYCYSLLVAKYASLMDARLMPQIVAHLLTILSIQSPNEQIILSFIPLTARIVTSIQDPFQISDEFIKPYLSSQIPEMAGLSACLIRFADPEDQESIFKEFFEANYANAESVFSFISRLKKPIPSYQSSTSLECLNTRFSDDVQEDDKILSLFIKSAFPLMGIDSLNQTSQFLCGPLSVCAFFSSIQESLQSNQASHKQIFSQYVDLAASLFKDLIEEFFSDIYDHTKLNEFTSMYVSYISSAKLCADSISAETLDIITNILHTTLTFFYNSDIMVDCCLGFLIRASELWSSKICDEFASLSFNFIYSQSFDPLNQRWEKVVMRAYGFHHTLLAFSHDQFVECVGRFFAALSSDESLIAEYEELDGMDARLKSEKLLSLFFTLYRLRRVL